MSLRDVAPPESAPPNRTLNRRDLYEHFPVRGGKAAIHREWVETIGGAEGLLRLMEERPGQVLRKGGGQGVTRTLEIGGRPLFTKEYAADSIARWSRDFVGAFRSFREWDANCRAHDAAVPCAGVVAVLSKRRGVRVDHLFCSEPAPGVSAAQQLPALREERDAIEEYLLALADFVAMLEGKGFCHAHLNCDHIFRDEQGAFTLIDLESSFFTRPFSPKCLAMNRVKLLRRMKGIVSEQDRTFFERACREAAGGS